MANNPQPTQIELAERVRCTLEVINLGYWTRKEAYAKYLEFEDGRFSHIPFGSFKAREWKKANKIIAKKMDSLNENLAISVLNGYMNEMQKSIEAGTGGLTKSILDSIVKFKGLAAADKLEISGKLKGKGIPFEMWENFDKKVREKKDSK